MVLPNVRRTKERQKNHTHGRRFPEAQHTSHQDAALFGAHSRHPSIIKSMGMGIGTGPQYGVLCNVIMPRDKEICEASYNLGNI